MKRLVVLVVTLALVVVGSLAVSAEELKINVNGGYQFGSFKATSGSIELMSSAANGFVLGADATIAGPFGAQFELASLTQSGFKSGSTELKNVNGSVLAMDFLGTYALPLNMDKVNLKGAVGYTMANDSIKQDLTDVFTGWKEEISTKYSGIPVGVLADVALTDQITIKGKLAYIVGLTVKSEQKVTDSPYLGSYTYTYDAKGSGLDFGVAATYGVMPNLAVEAGYNTTSYTYKPDGATNSATDRFGGFFVGAKYSF